MKETLETEARLIRKEIFLMLQLISYSDYMGIGLQQNKGKRFIRLSKVRLKDRKNIITTPKI